MSKDIWHEPTETPTEHKTLLFDSIEFDETEMGVYSGGLFHSYNEFEPMTPAGLSRWAYLSDFINCQKELIRTRKALDYAIDVIQTVAKMSDKLSREYGETLVEQLDNIQAYCWQEGYVLTHEEDLKKALTALEQKDK